MAGDRPFPIQSPPTLNDVTFTDCIEQSQHSANIFEIEHRATPFPFLKMPFELRRQVYYEYLEAHFTAQDDLIYETSLFEESQGLALLQVNAQIRLELKQILVRDKVIRVRISWQGWNFHPLSVLRNKLRSKASKINLKRAACIQVNIYAPHNKRLTDLICIWHSSREFCEKLGKFGKVKRLCIVFMESGKDQALRKESDWSWSRPENPSLAKRTLEKYEHLYFDKTDQVAWWTDEYDSTDGEANSDLKYILDQFSSLTNVKDVCIELPLSLRNNSRLQKMVQTTEDIMRMRRPPIDPGKNRKGMSRMFIECGRSLKLETGRNSKQRLKELDSCLEGLGEREMYLFQEIWPHLCCARRYPLWSEQIDWESWSDQLYPLWPCTDCGDNQDFRVYQHRDLCIDIISRLSDATDYTNILLRLRHTEPYYPIWKTELLQTAAVSPIVGDYDYWWREHRDRKPRWPHSTKFSDISQHCRELLENIQ